MEGINGRAASEPSSSDSSDFYEDDATQAHSVPEPPVYQEEEEDEDEDAPELIADPVSTTMPRAEDGDAAADDDDDDSSEMDMSEPSRPSTPEPVDAVNTAQAITVATTQSGAKRKLSDSADAASENADFREEVVKKRRISTPLVKMDTATPVNEEIAVPVKVEAQASPQRVRLLPELWQRVFSHLSPAMLCRCLRVCKDFNHYLTGLAAPSVSKKNPSTAQVAQQVDSESIWIQSRKNSFPALPRPLAGFTEHAMLKLIGGLTCQFCARRVTPIHANSHLNAGPGPNGVRVIWPFRVRSCGQCLEARIMKDVTVLATPEYKNLRLGVAHGYRSQDLHFATESARQMPGGIPGNLRFSKVNYVPDLEAIKGEEQNAKALGDGAADEWRKGLFDRGKQIMADSARWEKWELQMRPGADLAQVLREYDLASYPGYIKEVRTKPAGVNGVQPPPTANGTHPLPQPVHVFQNGYTLPFPGQQQHAQSQQLGPQYTSNAQPYFPQQSYRPVRNPHEVEEARQARKAEIERRCKELEPPVEPGILQHMESFQAAMQITTPLTDAAWEMLKPRILAQKEAAELAEHERASQLAALQAALPSVVLDDMIQKPAKEMYDREYEQAQEPLRRRLGEYADDYINGQWGGGKMLERDNAPIFALHVILHVRQRYVEDKQLGLLPTFEPPKRKENSRQSPQPEPFLSLDNMKWVYDNKVRPLTDVHRREHFICAGCADEKKPKWFAFEGLIQHYGAKHTTAFSKGNIVVHWQTAEWPEEPPFHTNPVHWLKVDRRVSDFKSHGRVRNTPQSGHEGPFSAPPAQHLPESAYHGTNGYTTASPSYAPTHFASPSQPAAHGYFHHQAAPVEPRINMGPEAQVSKISSDAREVWDSLDGIKDLIPSIRVHSVIHHTVSRFAERFHTRPHLDLFTDALATNASMRPLKNAHSLACKACIVSQSNGNSSQGSYWLKVHGPKLYNMSSMITHFKLMHLEQNAYLDWTTGMIELPDNQEIRGLMRTPGMDDDKLALIAAAFPHAFSTPLPKIGVVTEESANMAADGQLGSRLLDRLTKKQKSQPKRKGAKGANGQLDRDDSSEPLPEPTEDEYDPRRPMFVQPKVHAVDRSEYDSDARKTSAPAAPPTADAFNLNPETLAALQSLTGPGVTSQAPQTYGKRSRSPSVGRNGHVPEVAAPPPVATTGGQPDIAAILASLTGQSLPAPTAMPQTTVSSRADSAPRQSWGEQYGRPQHESHTHQEESRRPSSRYDNVHQAPRDVPQASDPLQELQAALAVNQRHFGQNHNQHTTYVEAPPHAPIARSPPRYQYIYDGEQHYGQPPAQTPIYRDAPVQYVQLPEREHAPQAYQYERAARPKPIYVDQYGRPLELIPIDSAPAPVQYAPNPYEQQQYGRRYEQAAYGGLPHGVQLQPVYDDRHSRYDARPASVGRP